MRGRSRTRPGERSPSPAYEAAQDDSDVDEPTQAIMDAATSSTRLQLAGQALTAGHMHQLRQALVQRLLVAGEAPTAFNSPTAAAPLNLVELLDVSANSTCGDDLAALLACRS